MKVTVSETRLPAKQVPPVKFNSNHQGGQQRSYSYTPQVMRINNMTPLHMQSHLNAARDQRPKQLIRQEQLQGQPQGGQQFRVANNTMYPTPIEHLGTDRSKNGSALKLSSKTDRQYPQTQRNMVKSSSASAIRFEEGNIRIQQSQQPLTFQTRPLQYPNITSNHLKKQRIIVVDESDHKLQLEVMKVKYKTLEERYAQLETQLRQKIPQIDNQTKMAHEITEDMDQEMLSIDRVEDIIAVRVEQQVESFKAENEQRQEQIKAKFEEYIQKLRTKNEQLTRHNQQLLNSSNNKAHMTGNFLIHKLQASDNDSYERKQQNNQQDYQIIVNMEDVPSLKLRVQQLSAELHAKNLEIQMLKANLENAQPNLPQTKFELERINKIAEKRQEEIIILRNKLDEYQKHYQFGQKQARIHMQQMQRNQHTLHQYQQDLLKTAEEIAVKDQTILKFQSQRQIYETKLAKMTEETKKLQNQVANNRQSSLEQQKNNKSLEENFTQTIKKLNEANRALSLANQEKTSKIKLLEDELRSHRLIQQETRRQTTESLSDTESKLAAARKRSIELEGELAQLKLELQHKKSRQVTMTPRSDGSLNKTNEQWAYLLQKKGSELDTKRTEYENSLRRLRQQCEQSYNQTLHMYEEKIQQLERKLEKRRETDHRSKRNNIHDNKQKSIKRVVSEKVFNEFETQTSSMLHELKQQLADFELKVNNVIELCKNEFSTKGQSYLRELKTQMMNINARIDYCKSQSNRLKKQAVQQCQRPDKLVKADSKSYLHQPQKQQAKIQSLNAELARYKKTLMQYEFMMYHSQIGKHYAPKSSESNFEQRIEILEEKVEFYKEKNSEMQRRVGNLLTLNSSLKMQLEEAAKTPASSSIFEISQKQQLANDQATARLQQKIRQLSDQLLHLKGQHLFKLQNCERDWQSKLSQQQSLIVDLNIKMAGLKNEHAINQNELKLHRDTLAHRENLIAELNNKVANMRKQLSDITQERRRRQELQATLIDTTSRLSNLTTQKNHLESQNSNIKKHVTYIQKQLLTANQKLTNLNNSHLALDLQLTQAKTAASFHGRHADELTQEVKTLQRYRTECDASANEDRHRMNQLQVKLRDTYYELEKINKINQSLQTELSSIKNSYNSQKQQLLKLSQQKRDLQNELNRLQMEVRLAESSASKLSSPALMQQYEQTIQAIREELIRAEEKVIYSNNCLTEWKRQQQQKLQSQRQSIETEYKQIQANLQQKLHTITEEFKKLYHHSMSLQEQINLSKFEKANIEMQARYKISQLQETLNSLNNNNSNSSTEKEQQELQHQELLEDNVKAEGIIQMLTQHLKQAETHLAQSTNEYEARFEAMNQQFQERYLSMEKYYTTEISLLQQLIQGDKSQLEVKTNNRQEPLETVYKHILITVMTLGYLLERIRSNCQRQLVLLAEIDIHTQETTETVEGLTFSIEDTATRVEELIRAYSVVEGIATELL